jgi:hypothetical protein
MAHLVRVVEHACVHALPRPGDPLADDATNAIHGRLLGQIAAGLARTDTVIPRQDLERTLQRMLDPGAVSRTDST